MCLKCVRRKGGVDAQLRTALPSECGFIEDASNHYLGRLAKVRGGTRPSRFDNPWLVSIRYKMEVLCSYG